MCFKKSMFGLCNWRAFCLVYAYAAMGFALANMVMLIDIYVNAWKHIYNPTGVKIVLSETVY